MLENTASPNDDINRSLEPLPIFSDVQSSNWQLLPEDDPVIAYVSSTLWKESSSALEWKLGRFSKAANPLREQSTQWTAIT